MTPETAIAVDSSLIGQFIDERYRIDAVIGVGGLGSVYRATHLKLQRAVAVKLLHENLGTNDIQRGRFAREATALAALEHPNIVSVLDYGVSADRPYLVMELLEGETLSMRLQRGRMPTEMALWIVRQLLAALAFMHRAGLVHRDLKPSNVFLQRLKSGFERVKVLDFGLAKFTAPVIAGGEATLTRDGAIVGTPAYMSPEQATGEVVDSRGDVYAVGVILYRMLSGRLPFEGDATDQVRGHLVAPVPALELLDEAVDPELDALIQHAMAKTRAERFDDASAMLRSLMEIVPKYQTTTMPVRLWSDLLDQNNATSDWLAHADDSSEIPTTPRPRRARVRVAQRLRGLLWTGARLIAGASVLLVAIALGLLALMMTNESDRAELAAIRRRVGERLIERSRSEPEPTQAPERVETDARAATTAPRGSKPADPRKLTPGPRIERSPEVPRLDGAALRGHGAWLDPSSEPEVEPAPPPPSWPLFASGQGPLRDPGLDAEASAAAGGAANVVADRGDGASQHVAAPGVASVVASSVAPGAPGAAKASAPSGAPGAAAAPGNVASAPRGEAPTPAERGAAAVTGSHAPPSPVTAKLSSDSALPPSAAGSSSHRRSTNTALPPAAAVAARPSEAAASKDSALRHSDAVTGPPPSTAKGTRALGETIAAAAASKPSARQPSSDVAPLLAAKLDVAPPDPGPAGNPWAAPLPLKLRAARRAVLNASRGNEPIVVTLRAYNRDHPTDPRGHLLLAELYMNRQWRGDALAQYSYAIADQLAAREAPEVLPGLLKLIVHGEFARPAERLITRNYGAAATGGIDRALDALGDRDERAAARLRALRARLTSSQL